ncbi:MAG TPA: hypothetical protein VM262_05605 [Acidimicrobiales bacterium]|nr:hypothetical protein [Acidimicrobiales bacterium]
MDGERVRRVLRLTPAADDGWQRYADEHGVSVTALVEALGQQLAARHPADWHQAIETGREIDARRARRRRAPGAGEPPAT